jgi:RNA polymerase sigma factor (sigma-70 family)
MSAIDAVITDVGPAVRGRGDAVVAFADEPESTDIDLVSACLQGHEDAWARLIDRYQRLIYSIPIKYGFTPEEATDIFQETCVELLSALPRLREPRALPKWLQQVTVHKCAHLKEQHRRHTWSTDADNQAIERVADTTELSEQVLCEVEREQALRSAVLGLPLRCRRLIDMLFFENTPRPYNEIARELALACGSIGFIRGRCLKRLRTELQKSGFH